MKAVLVVLVALPLLTRQRDELATKERCIWAKRDT